jgi:hypothetical protein
MRRKDRGANLLRFVRHSRRGEKKNKKRLLALASLYLPRSLDRSARLFRVLQSEAEEVEMRRRKRSLKQRDWSLAYRRFFLLLLLLTKKRKRKETTKASHASTYLVNLPRPHCSARSSDKALSSTPVVGETWLR